MVRAARRWCRTRRPDCRRACARRRGCASSRASASPSGRSATSGTAIRGGAGYFNITTSGALFYALTGTLQSNLQSYYNSVSSAGPAFAFPSTGNNTALAGQSAGTGVFYSAVDNSLAQSLLAPDKPLRRSGSRSWLWIARVLRGAHHMAPGVAAGAESADLQQPDHRRAAAAECVSVPELRGDL